VKNKTQDLAGMHQAASTAFARLLATRLDELGRVTDERGRLTRTFLSPAMKRANALVGRWMKEAGLQVRVDAVGNLIGRLESTRPKAKTLLFGSHLDTVRNAGKYDGALGVLLPIVALAELKRRGVQLPFAVEVLGFSEEEGVRFSSAYLGSKGYSGKLRASDLKLRDADGVTVREALEKFHDVTFSPPKPAHRTNNLLGYLEVHIEQGPVLEARKLPVGVASAIAGQTRAKLTFNGKAGHAGTTPMDLRRDAFAGAAEFALAAEKLARSTPGLVVTVGTIAVKPGAANVIPAEANFSLDVRHARDDVRAAALIKLRALGTRTAKARGLRFSWQITQENGAVACSPELTTRLARSVRAVQGKSISLVSGAGHDAVVMSSLTPVAMLFVRCREGLSHHPDEYASPQDIDIAFRVLVDFLEKFSANYTDERG
jgi:allantoate deiminase